MLIIFTMFIVVGCIILYCGLEKGIYPLASIGLLTIIFTIVFGFGFAGFGISVGNPSYTRIAPTEILIGNSDIIVRFQDENDENKKTIEVRDNTYANVMNAKSNNIEILREDTKNSYGIQLTPTYSIVTKEK
jgi:hypothetical protein